MIRHIVLYRLRDTRPDKVEAAAQMLRSLGGKVEGLLETEVGRDVLAGENSYHLALTLTFDSMEHFQALSEHPAYKPVRAYMHAVRESSVACTYPI